MSAVARHTDPATSHEAAAGVDLARSQMAVLTYLRSYCSAYFTDKTLVAGYRKVQENTSLPVLSDSRIRTARLELVTAGLLYLAGETEGPTRRERVWTCNPELAGEWDA